VILKISFQGKGVLKLNKRKLNFKAKAAVMITLFTELASVMIIF
jgi:hypothetical protein